MFHKLPTITLPLGFAEDFNDKNGYYMIKNNQRFNYTIYTLACEAVTLGS
jgi:hypothetical protein